MYSTRRAIRLVISGAILGVLPWATITGCKRKASPKPRPQSPLPGILVEGVGVLKAGQKLDISRLRTDGGDRYRRWRRQDQGGRKRFLRAYPISRAFGSRIRPTHIYRREEIWTLGGRVVHAGQGYTAVSQQCTSGMRATHKRLSALVKVCMVKGSRVLRQVARVKGRSPGLVHYLCERGPVALVIDLLPRVPEFVDQGNTRVGSFSVGQFWRADVKAWLQERFTRGEPSNAGAFFAELAPLTEHLAKCRGAGN